MAHSQPDEGLLFKRLEEVLAPDASKVLAALGLSGLSAQRDDRPALVVLAAGKGTRFGADPKCIQPVNGKPLAAHSIDAFQEIAPVPAVCVVGYRKEDVAAALGNRNVYVASANPAGGTGFAAFEALSVPELAERDFLLVLTMGDRVVPASIFRRILGVHHEGAREAELTFLTAVHEVPRQAGKGRIRRNDSGRVLNIVEERDLPPGESPSGPVECNCPLYVIRAKSLFRHLREVTNGNAQGQYYLTDIVQSISQAGGEIRTLTITPEDEEYEILCADVTRPADLETLETVLTRRASPPGGAIEKAVRAITADRHPGQIASIARQLQELVSTIAAEDLSFRPDRPVAIGICGGRVRIAFMHPDMGRFYGPAWQMPIGAATASGREQIIMLVQAADDGRVHLLPTNFKFRERIDSIPTADHMYPEQVSGWHEYEQFGTRMSESLLLSLGYFSDEELEQRRRNGLPVPPPALWVSNSMRRPFALVQNAIASLRTLSSGDHGTRVRSYLARDTFRGLRLASTGSIPEGGFSSSSAVTVATQNAINALWDLDIAPDVLVQLACQAEYGTGVRAGSLDQATEQKGRYNEGALMSSNPRENYRVIGTFPVPSERFRMFFPYTVERDRTAWRWSCGTYGEMAGSGPLTTGEMRKLTGKAAEIAAILLRLPLDRDFFQFIEQDLFEDGLLSEENRRWICSVLQELPLLSSQDDLRTRVMANRAWYAEQIAAVNGIEPAAAEHQAAVTLESLFAGWRNPVLKRCDSSGNVVCEEGVPLRAMVAYLFGEVAKNFYLLHHPERWIEYVTLSQRGDRCFDIDPVRLPSRADMERPLEWERDWSGPELLEEWLRRFQATPADYNRGLDDAALTGEKPPEFHRLEGSNFFRGLALIDVAEAMLKRAFGENTVAVRVNAAGQGDYFQVHVDRQKADPESVKSFIRNAFYRRFGLWSQPHFVEVHPGGGAVGVRLDRFDTLGTLIGKLQSWAAANT
ncbi:MAG: NTP transferase domain-containing protein [Bryobacterales bacterium]|nr:NTP transferase domain-containing protein [Bryobacterales bacterium]